MKNTFITFFPGELEFNMNDFALNMQEFSSPFTGFICPDYEIIIECEENKNSFKLSYVEDDFDEDEVKRRKIIVAINHKESFIELVKSEIFIKELYTALHNPEFYELMQRDDFNIYVMKSANV